MHNEMKRVLPKSKLTGKAFDTYLLKRKDEEDIIEEVAYVSHEDKVYFTIVFLERRNCVPL